MVTVTVTPIRPYCRRAQGDRATVKVVAMLMKKVIMMDVMMTTTVI